MLEKLNSTIKQIDGIRQYSFEMPDGSLEGPFPSVTTILSKTESGAGLRNWQKKVGKEEAERVRMSASARGNAVHKVIETLLETGELIDYDEELEPWVESMIPVAQKISEVLLVEGAVWHSSGFAGTIDCAAIDDGELTIMDWKTTTKKKYPKYVRKSLLQATAYGAALVQRYPDVGKVKKIKVVYGLPFDDMLELKEPDIHEAKGEDLRELWDEWKDRYSDFRDKF